MINIDFSVVFYVLVIIFRYIIDKEILEKLLFFIRVRILDFFFFRVVERKLFSIYFFFFMVWGVVGRNNELRWEIICFVLRKK